MRRPCLLGIVLTGSLAAALPGPEAYGSEPLHQEWRLARFRVDSGLPADKVHDVVEAADGTIWVRTDLGLAWYDGFRFHAVTTDPERPQQRVETSAAAPGHGLLAVHRGKLFRIDRHRSHQVDVGAAVSDAITLDDDSLLLLVDDWPHTWRDSTLRAVPRPAEVPADGRSNGWLHAVSGRPPFWSSRHGTFAWNGHGFDRRSPRIASTVRPDGDRILWAEYRGERLRSLAASGADEAITGSGRGVITAIAVGPDGTAIAAYASGDLRIRRNDDWRKVEPVPWSLRAVRCLRFASDGDLWAGTDDGLSLLNLASTRWDRLLDDSLVNALLVTRGGDLWVGTDRSAIRLDRTGAIVERLDEATSVALGAVTALGEDRDGAIWIGSGAAFPGAVRWQDGTARHFGAADGLGAPRVHRIVADRAGDLWFLGISERYSDSPAEPGAFRHDGIDFDHWGTDRGLPSGRVYDFVEAADGALWFATVRGLSRYRDGAWRHWGTDDGLSYDRVYAVAIDDRGRTWFAHQTKGGLGYLDGDRPRYLTVDDGLVGNTVWSISAARDGTLWIGTDSGVSNYRDGVFATLAFREGLEHTAVWPIVPVTDRVLIGTRGAGVYVLSLAERSDPAPAVTLTTPKVEPPGTLVRWQVYPYRGRSDRDRALTRYRLDNRPWSDWSRVREAAALNLSPGRHRIAVQARGLFGQLAAPVATELEVPPPLYRHPAFSAGVAVGVGALAWLGLSHWRRERRHHDRLRDAEAHYRSLLENTSDLVTELDADGRVTYQSRAVARTLGLSPAAIDGRPFAELLAPASRPVVASLIAQSRARASRSGPVEVVAVAADGSRLQLELVADVVQGIGDGERVLVSSRDVSARREAELERSQLEATMRETQKLESLGLLAGGIAHDFNNLLVSMLGNAELALDGRDLPPRTRAQVARIQTAALRASELTKQLLAYSGRGRFLVEPVDVNAIVREMVELLEVAVAKRAEIDIRTPPGELTIYADATQLRQVLLNLITNAAEALGDRHGRIEVTTGRRSLAEVDLTNALVAGEATSGWIAIEVSDDGEGMEMAALPRIFEPFYTTKFTGRGLGLAAVLGIVRGHNGAILADTAPGRGTRFTCLFPAHDGAGAEVPQAPATTAAVTAGMTALIVDDDESVRGVLATLLTERDIASVAAGDGPAALDLIRGEGEGITVVFLDLIMPGMRGTEVLRELRKLRPDIPVVMMSGFPADEALTPDGTDGHPDAFLQKPFRGADVLAALSRALV